MNLIENPKSASSFESISSATRLNYSDTFESTATLTFDITSQRSSSDNQEIKVKSTSRHATFDSFSATESSTTVSHQEVDNYSNDFESTIHTNSRPERLSSLKSLYSDTFEETESSPSESAILSTPKDTYDDNTDSYNSRDDLSDTEDSYCSEYKVKENFIEQKLIKLHKSSQLHEKKHVLLSNKAELVLDSQSEMKPYPPTSPRTPRSIQLSSRLNKIQSTQVNSSQLLMSKLQADVGENISLDYCEKKLLVIKNKNRKINGYEKPLPTTPKREQVSDYGFSNIVIEKMRIHNLIQRMRKVADSEVHNPKRCKSCRDKYSKLHKTAFIRKSVSTIQNKSIQDKFDFIQYQDALYHLGTMLETLPRLSDSRVHIWNRLMDPLKLNNT